jgi:hypothetical protein
VPIQVEMSPLHENVPWTRGKNSLALPLCGQDEKMIRTTLMESDASLVMAGGVKNFYDDMHFSPLKVSK